MAATEAAVHPARGEARESVFAEQCAEKTPSLADAGAMTDSNALTTRSCARL